MQYDSFVGLDFESYGATDLPSRGLHNYTHCPTFQPLIAGIAQTDGVRVLTHRIPLYANMSGDRERLKKLIHNKMIVAHNAPFEQAVLRSLGIDVPSHMFVDSAVIARAMGAAGKLEAAAPQLLGVDKMEDGKRLIRMFSIPGKYQEANDSPRFDPQVITDNPVDWDLFGVYCELDAELGLRLAMKYLDSMPPVELHYNALTMDMNAIGWPVDLPVVEEMQRRYLENQAAALEEFRATHDAADLNLNSLKQMKEWCAERGIKARSFDEKNVTKMIERIKKKLNTMPATEWNTKSLGYYQVLDLLKTKQILGGSSLKKLQTILDTTGGDGRLHDQYLHIGAGQSWRTTGKGVQMQNLKRLDSDNVADMLELYEDTAEDWDNDKLAENIRQCFTSSHPQGRLIVGDFKSVESRGLAWLAGDTDKLDAYRQGKDMYKVQATLIYPGLAYDAVTKAQRQTGKVGELSCGYQASGPAVQSFAEGMGITMSEGEASNLVTEWRAANPKIVRLWWDLDDALHQVIENPHVNLASIPVGYLGTYKVRIFTVETPLSLLKQHPGAQSIVMELMDNTGRTLLTRYFHGCYVRGRSICYYKPSELKSGDLWKNHFTDPKTKQVRFYSLYGGKLTGILTQSFCRELFFRALKAISLWVETLENVDLIGQFHDEIVMDWRPPENAGQMALDQAMMGMNRLMSDNRGIHGFPLEADIKYDYRYTK